MQYSNCVCVEGDWRGGMICSTATVCVWKGTGEEA